MGKIRAGRVGCVMYGYLFFTAIRTLIQEEQMLSQPEPTIKNPE